MLRNFVNDNDLKQFYPNLARQLWSTQTSYATQINTAFDIVMNDLHNMGIRPERATVQLDLNNNGNDKNLPMQTITATGIITSSAYQTNYERRVVLDIGSCTGNWNFYIDGNSEQNIPNSTDNTWFLQTSLFLTSSYANSTVTQVISKTSDWVRYRIEPTTGTSINYTCYMISDIFSQAIIRKAFTIIFRDFVQTEGDIWDVRRGLEEKDYQAQLLSTKFTYDANYSGTTDAGETSSGMWDLTFSR